MKWTTSAIGRRVGAGALAFALLTTSAIGIADAPVVGAAGEVPSVQSLAPARLLETRSGNASLQTDDGQFLGDGVTEAGGVVELTVAGRGGVPVDAEAVFLNVTVVNPSAGGFLTAFPCGSTPPNSSNVNYSRGEVVPNAVLAKIGVDGKVCLFTLASTHLVVDVNGYVGPPTCVEVPLEITSHVDDEIVDTSSDGTSTGTVVISGVAPAGTTAVSVDDGDETAAATLTIDGCSVAWTIEANVDIDETRTFAVTARGSGATQTADVTLDLIAAGAADTLVDPTFSETPQFASRLLTYDEPSGSLTFAGNTTGSLSVGDGLVSAPNEAAPSGYLRVVTGLSFDGTTTTVTTRQAGLTEFVRQIDVQVSVEPGDAVTMVLGTDSEPGLKSETGLEKELALLTIGELEFDVDFEVDPGFEIDIDIDFRRNGCRWCLPSVVVDRIFFEVSLSFSATAAVTYRGANLINEQRSFGPRFDDFRLAKFVIPLPIGAITIDLEAEGQAFIKAEIDAAAELSYGLGFEVVAGWEYRGDGTGRGGYSDAGFTGGLSDDGLGLAAGISASVSVGLEMDLEALLWGQAGFEIEARPQIRLEAFADAIARQIPWTLKLVVPFDANLEVEIDLGPIEYDREFGDLEIAQLSITLFEGVLFGDEIAEAVLGDGVTEVDSSTTGSTDQFDRFDGFAPGESAWVLSTGQIDDVDGAAFELASTDLPGVPGNARLTSLAGYETTDAVSVSITVIPDNDTLNVRYVFASEEYPDFVGSTFNDVMAVLIDGINCAVVPGTLSPVSVNTISEFTNSEFYVDNTAGAAGYNTALGGLTVPLTCSRSVTPGRAVTVEIIVADSGDGIYDSAVALIDGGIWST